MFGNFRILYVSNESLVIMANPSKRKLKISSKTDKDNVAVTKSRKRQCSDYHQVEDDIQFIVKKQKRECEIVMKSLKESSKAVRNQKKSELESCVSTNPSVDNREINRRSPNGFLLPDPLPRGEVLVDTIKQKWILGKAIGVGGFGELYLASYQSTDGKISPEKFVIKVEPHSNGPLFVEVHFYIRATKTEEIEKFKMERDIKHLGIPKLVANGSHVKNGQVYRFLVMERFGTDLQRIIDNSEGNRFTTKTACSVTLQVIDSLEYIHSQGYVHKDIKGSNLLVGLGLDGQHLVHLVDYGLCSKFRIADFHKQYKHDMRWAHEGTMEYTSRDAHIGCASRRGDIEVLFYNLIEWFGGSLPWDRERATPDVTKTAKFLAFKHIHKFLNICFRGTDGYPSFLVKFMKYINGLNFEEEPNYQYLRDIVTEELLKAGCVRDGKLEFKLAKLSDSKIMDKENLDPSLLFGPSKKPPSERVSSVFDMACVSETSYQRMRENVWAERAKKSLDNPTRAMLDIMKKMKTKQIPSKPRKGIKRSKSFNLGEITDNTPAMIEVLKLKKMRSVEDSSDESEVQISHIVTRPKIKFPVSITSEIINPKDTKAKRSPNRKTELQKLDSSFEEHVKRRRTRGNQKSANREIRSNLRSALNIGLSMFRTVSQSIPKFLKYE